MFIESLRTTPIIQTVCKHTGISRTTYYRWMEKDPKFAKTSQEALLEGRSLINDLAESQLISSIKDKRMPAISYWLSHNHPNYAPKSKESAKEPLQYLTPEQVKALADALRLTAISSDKPYEETKPPEQPQ